VKVGPVNAGQMSIREFESSDRNVGIFIRFN
jgi:hypothetical protein